MAEGILRASAGGLLDVLSAGSRPTGTVHPAAIAVMEEIGIDISGHHSKPLEPILEEGITTVITVCDNADQSCPTFPGEVDRFHWPFEDPPQSIRDGESELDAFRRVRDEIRKVFEAYAAGCRQAFNNAPTKENS